MIKIPNKIVPFIAEDLLKVFLTALFIDFKDDRLICLIDDTTVEKRSNIIRNSKVFTELINALDLFGEEDVIQLLAPKITLMSDELSLGVDFEESLERIFNTLL